MLPHLAKFAREVVDDLHFHFEAEVEFLGLMGGIDRASDIERDVGRLFKETFGN